MTSLTLLELFGFANAALVVAMLAMRTMIPLRIAGIMHNIASIVFGWFAGVYPMLIQHSILLPLNAWRLREMRRLIQDVKRASAGTHDMEWIKPFTTRKSIRAGHVMFRKGDQADRMFFVLSGEFRVVEIGINISDGALVGELGFLSPGGRRTQTLECVADAVILEITYDRIEELYFQDPTFGLYFLRLSSARLFDNIGRLEEQLGAKEAKIARLQESLKARSNG
ncbi:MAG: cyclic nucleotide-binding domain-containing protein [Pseudorhodoplanes sp.]|nr:cyclic nucleotide-binding domain-containing protein [Pseudorhodoplanes sp.]